MKKIVTIILKYLSLFLVTLLILFTLLVLAAKIPRENIQENIMESQQAFTNNQQLEKKVKKFDKTLLHAYADAILLNIIYCIDSENPVESVMEAKYYSKFENDLISNNIQELIEDNGKWELKGNVQYMRYWHGSISIIRPLLTILNLQQIYRLNAVILLVLAIILIIYLIKKKQKNVAIALIVGFVMCSVFIVPFSLEYTWMFLLMLITSILAIKIEKSDKKLNILFFIIGIITCYLDFLTTEIITILVPVIIVLMIRYQENRITNFKQGFQFVLRSCLLWFISYVAMWFAKWILASVILRINALEYVKNNAMLRINGEIADISKQMLPLEAIVRNFFALYPFNMIENKIQLIILPVILFIIEIIFIRKKDRKELWISALLLLIATIPYIRYMVLANHSYYHSFFNFRSQLRTIISLILAMISSFDEKLVKKEIKFRKKRN